MDPYGKTATGRSNITLLYLLLWTHAEFVVSWMCQLHFDQ